MDLIARISKEKLVAAKTTQCNLDVFRRFSRKHKALQVVDFGLFDRVNRLAHGVEKIVAGEQSRVPRSKLTGRCLRIGAFIAGLAKSQAEGLQARASLNR